jgi:hypothetical protein
VCSLADTANLTDVPFLGELLNYLPINSSDKKDVNTYLNNITNAILANYSNEQYQFAYLGLHLLYMTYIYFSVRKVSVVMKDRYEAAAVLLRPYGDYSNMDSAFGYSEVSESELPRILKIVSLDETQLGKIKRSVKRRNDLVHANGRFEISNEKTFFNYASELCDSTRDIHSRMEGQIRLWFKDFLLKYCNKQFPGYDEINDIITEQMIPEFNLSVQELLVCNEMGVKQIASENPEYKDALNEFTEALKEYCEEQGFVN